MFHDALVSFAERRVITMAYIRKTKDEYQLLFHNGQTWEYLLGEDTLEKAAVQEKEYIENIPEYQYKIVKKRIPVQ